MLLMLLLVPSLNWGGDRAVEPVRAPRHEDMAAMIIVILWHEISRMTTLSASF